MPRTYLVIYVKQDLTTISINLSKNKILKEILEIVSLFHLIQFPCLLGRNMLWVGRIPLLSWPVCACSSSFPSFPIMLDYKYSVAKFTHPLVSVCTPWWPKTFWFPQLQGQTRLSTYYIREVSITKYIPSTQLDRWFFIYLHAIQITFLKQITFLEKKWSTKDKAW